MTNDNQPQAMLSVPKRLYALLLGILVLVAGQGVLLWLFIAPTLFPPKMMTKDEITAVLDAPAPLTANALLDLVQTYCALTPYQIEGESLEPAYMDRSRQIFYTGDRCPLPAIVRSGAVVLLETGAVNQLAAKFVRAMPGDSIALDPRPGRVSVLTVNGRDVVNSVGQPYTVARDRQGLLALYIRDYGGRIPDQSYLLMGDQIEGALDATQFGLVNIADIKGVMRTDNEPWAGSNMDDEMMASPPALVSDDEQQAVPVSVDEDEAEITPIAVEAIDTDAEDESEVMDLGSDIVIEE